MATRCWKAARLIEENRITGLRKVIDFSGDSLGNFSGVGIAEARASVLAAGITINGLPILDEGEDDPLAEIYRDQLIGGPGAFVIATDRTEGFVEAVRRKLILEIAGDLPSPGRGAGRRTRFIGPELPTIRLKPSFLSAKYPTGGPEGVKPSGVSQSDTDHSGPGGLEIGRRAAFLLPLRDEAAQLFLVVAVHRRGLELGQDLLVDPVRALRASRPTRRSARPHSSASR